MVEAQPSSEVLRGAVRIVAIACVMNAKAVDFGLHHISDSRATQAHFRIGSRAAIVLPRHARSTPEADNLWAASLRYDQSSGGGRSALLAPHLRHTSCHIYSV